MRVTAIEEVTTRKEVLQRTECDKCGLPEVEPDDVYEVFECRLEITEGYNWPGDRIVKILGMDLCPTCAASLQELLKVNGYRLNVEK